MDKKITNKPQENVLYLSEEDARALGIVEGETQSIYVDGKNVPLTFVDEHELFEASEEEIRILNKALDLRQRELEAKFGMGDDSEANYYRAIEGEPDYSNAHRGSSSHPDHQDSQSLIPYSQKQAAKEQERYYQPADDADDMHLDSKKNLFGSIKTFFNTNNKYKATPTHEPEDVLERNKYKNRTDIFTNEEIEIIQEVIARTQARQQGATNRSAPTHELEQEPEEERYTAPAAARPEPTTKYEYQYVVERPVYVSSLKPAPKKAQPKKAKTNKPKKKVISVDEGTEVELIVKKRNKPIMKKTISTTATTKPATSAKPEKITMAKGIHGKNPLKKIANSKTNTREVTSARKKEARRQARRQARLGGN